ncbi:MAG: choice-of-anchor L domain-containing protein [Bacteroidota bacterium]
MKQILTFFSLILTIGLFSQPVNDDCSGIINLGVAPNCDSTIYNNVGATESNIGADNFPSCFKGVPDRDVWFQFTATLDFFDYRIEVTGCEDPMLGLNAMSNPQIAIYRGDCEFDGLQELNCISAEDGESSVFIDLNGLTPNITYFLRINDWTSTAASNEGAFKLCVREKPPVNTVDQDGSTECSGTLADSGGENGDYSGNENNVFTICPTQPHECILFNMQYYNIEFRSDKILFFDGSDTTDTQIGNISGDGVIPTVNEGGVCYSVAASSGCLTIQFTSDNSLEFEGFLGTWQCTSEACPAPSEMLVDTDADQDEIVESLISGQTLISLVDVNCSNGQVGTFQITDDTDLGMDRGLVLSTGSVLDINQPAPNLVRTAYCGVLCSDEDLNILSNLYGNGQEAEDACIVEMDVLAASNEITFEYVFGSEEYPDFIDPNTAFNDIFAFLVSGPGIVGDPNLNNKLNVATLPDGTFVQIRDVNHSENWEYFRDNTNSQSIVYGGLTSDSLGAKKSLTARVPTIPCETYTLKFAIADRGDSEYDSGVFISKINSGTPEVGVDFQNGIDYLVESCTQIPDKIVIDFGTALNSPQSYKITVGGTAEQGVDYNLDIPDSVTFVTGTEIFSFPISIIVDTEVEGTENIEITLSQDFGCGEMIISSFSFEVVDLLTVDILDDLNDTLILCATEGCIPLEATGAQSYSWFPDTLFNDDTLAMPTLCTQQSQWVFVEGTLGSCTDIDSVYIDVVNIEVNIFPDEDNLVICEGTPLELTALNNVNDQGILWTSPDVDFADPTNPVQILNNEEGDDFESALVTIELAGCSVSDGINVQWIPFDLPKVIGDTTICQNSTVQLANEIDSESTTYTWTPDDFLSPSADVSGPFATPEVTTTYTLISSSSGPGNETCADTSSVTVTVLLADIDIEPGDSVFLCLGESAVLTANTSNNVIDLVWSPLDFLTDVGPNQVEVNPPSSQYYYATIETVDCVVTDSIWVQVDSLPDLSIMADPEKETYCEGEEVTLTSTTYEPANFPDLEFMWADGLPGVQTPDSFLNLVFIAQEDFFYVRTSTINACSSIDSIFIDVTPIITISVVPDDTTVCAGQPVQFTIDGPAELTEFMWMPPDNLSCTDCREPVATPFQSGTWQVEAEFEGCPVGASASINVPTEFFQYTGDNPICPGTPVLLNEIFIPGATYTWTSSDGSLNTNEPQPTVSPTQETTYNLVATIDDCVFETSITLQVLQDFSLSIEPIEVVCPGSPVTLSASISPELSGVTFTWTNLSTGFEVLGPTVNLNPAVTEDWQVTATDSRDCFSQTATQTVEVAPAYTISVNPPEDNVIAGTPTTFTVEASIPGIDFVWEQLGTGGGVVGMGESITVTNCDTTFYEVTGTDFNECPQTDTVVQNVLDGFRVDSLIVLNTEGDTLVFSDPLMTDSMIFEGQEVEMFAQLIPEIPGSTYIWLIDGEVVAETNSPSSGTLFLPETEVDRPITFTVRVISPTGCDDETEQNVTLKNNPVEAPNVFTPNSDSINDVFELISLVPVEISEFRIWNRWGKLVYENEDGANSWDGTIDGDAATSDVFIYSITYQIPGAGNPTYNLKGDVTLLR